MLADLRPQTHQKYSSLPVLGPVVDAFTDWVSRYGYAFRSMQMQLGSIKHLACFFHRRGRHNWRDLKSEDFIEARRQLGDGNSSMGGTIRQVQRFLEKEHGWIPTPIPIPGSEVELTRYSDYLKQVRGFAQHTIAGSLSCVRAFLKFIGYERSRRAIAQLDPEQIEAFLRSQAKKCSRRSLKHVNWSVRGFLRFQHAAGVLSRPLHELINGVPVYRLEQLPRAIPWTQIQALLRSINRHQPDGLRDYTILFLMAAYGLRRGEVVALRLDDIDWRARILRVPQRKTGQHLALPLTDEVGDCLQRYLREGRPSTEHRELFLRHLAPVVPLHRNAVNHILNERIRDSGLQIPTCGTHCFRHSFAMRLLHKGVALKTIGDTLGHRAVESTGVYLRLGIEELRGVGLEVPPMAAAAEVLGTGWQKLLPPTRHKSDQPSPTRFRSGLGAAMKRYLTTQRALGRLYVKEAGILLRWDAFLYERQGGARSVSRQVFQHWAGSLRELAPVVQRHHLRCVRNFLVFHSRDHRLGFVPDPATFPKRSSPRPPRLVSKSEMARLLATAATLPASPANPLKAQTVRIALILLFCCGLRRGELLRLRLAHFDPLQDLLRVEGTKFHKSRLVPLPASVARELRAYLDLCRCNHLSMEPERFLIWNRDCSGSQSRRTCNAFNRTWWRLCLTSGVLDERGRPPRLHDLRHSSAVAALERWYAQGQNVQSKLQQLATYLGHVGPTSTHYYLHLTPALREAASRRFRQHFAPFPRKEGRV